MHELIQKLSIYSSVPIYFLGFIGNLLTIFCFLSSKNFREHVTIFYLTILSIFDLGKLFLVTFSFVLPWGYNIDSTLSFFIFCKLRDFIFNILALGSITCLLLASVNQYFTSYYRPMFANIQLAQRLMILFGFIYTIYNIPHLFYSNYIKTKLICQIENRKYHQYYVYSYFLVIHTLIPLCLIVLVGYAHRNFNRIIDCKTSTCRNQLEKHLTSIIFVQILVHLCTFLPYAFLNIYKLITNKVDFQTIEVLAEHLVPISYAVRISEELRKIYRIFSSLSSIEFVLRDYFCIKLRSISFEINILL